MKVLVTGAAGQLGCDVMTELTRRGHSAVGVDIQDMDITDRDGVRTRLTDERPDAVIHCAAWTAVDAAEEETNQEKVYAVNATGTENIARACAEISAKLLYLSTDYVFDGHGTRPWEPDDVRHPLNRYGASKSAGEEAVESLSDRYFIVRIAWVFGVHGKNFVKTMLNLGKTRTRISVVNDQIGTPTYTPDLARLLVDMIETERYGRYHATNEGGYISWYDFTCEIMRLAASANPIYDQVQIEPISSAAYSAKAKRPTNSRMDKQKLRDNGFAPLPNWQDALARYLREASIRELMQ